MYFEIPGTIRIKKNSRRIFPKKGGKGIINLPSKAYKEWEEMVRWHVISRLDPHWEPSKGLVHVRFVAYYKGPKPDLSGAMESVGDAFEGMLCEDDTQIESWDGSRLIHDKANPRLCFWAEQFGDNL